MKIAFVSSEVVPFAKTGGLADVAGALPNELCKLGHEVSVFMPLYKCINRENYKLKPLLSDIAIDLGDEVVLGNAFSCTLRGGKTRIIFIEQEDFFNRAGLYQSEGKDFEDNAERFIYFSRAVLEICKRLDWKPNIVHCNDWQTGLIPVYLKSLYAHDPFFSEIRSIFTIHNLAYQGVFHKSFMEKTGLSWDLFTMDKLEFWGKLNFLKSGLVFSDLVTTVSERYSQEIQTEEYGAGLNGVLRGRKNDLFGIINGVDYKIFSPEKDTLIYKNYSSKSLEKKLENKKYLQKQVGLRSRKGVPLFGIISRLADQKGFDILSEVMESFMQLNCQLILLGTGEPKYHKLFEGLEAKYPSKLKALLKFDATMAQQIYAGCDLFLMPSRYEPCGLGQLISLKYGTIPVVRETGGLADTIIDFDLAKDFEG
ncbi:MAG: glycogen/starch synthase, partial [Candidatus Margulisiibacteriota bacterium]